MIIQKKVETTQDVDVALTAVAGCHWELAGDQLTLKVTADGAPVGCIDKEKVATIWGKNTPGFNMDTAFDAIRDAYKAMKAAGVW